MSQPSPTFECKTTRRADRGHLSYVLGIAALIAAFVPPGLFVAPVVGLAAIGTGTTAWSETAPGERDEITLGIVFGLVATVVSALVIVLFRHVIWHALTHVQAG